MFVKMPVICFLPKTVATYLKRGIVLDEGSVLYQQHVRKYVTVHQLRIYIYTSIMSSSDE